MLVPEAAASASVSSMSIPDMRFDDEVGASPPAAAAAASTLEISEADML